MSGILTNEKQLLQQQKRILMTRLERLEKTSDNVSKPKEEKVSELTEKLDALKIESQDTKDKIAKQERQGMELRFKETRLQKDIDQINQQMKNIQQQSQQGKEEYLKTKKAHLKRELNEQQSRNESIKKQITDRKRQRQQSQAKVETWRNRQNDLELALKTSGEELAKAQTEEAAIREESKALEGQRGKTEGELKKDIDTLELRKAVLLSSVEAIRNKYNQDKDTIKEFLHSDQKELKNYLETLRVENVSLTDKALSLRQTVQRLESQ